MTANCVVCKGKAYRRPELMFHSFPKDEALREKWIKNMGIQRKLSKKSKLCSIHFSQNCFRAALCSGNPRLIQGAIPTIKTLQEFIELETYGEELPENSLPQLESQKSQNSQLEMVINKNVEYTQQESSKLIENVDPDEIEREKEKRMNEELQYSCQNINVKSIKEEKFRTLPETLKVMYFMEAQEIIRRQDKEIKSLKRNKITAKKKIENLTLFTNSMKKEIQKRSKTAKIEW